MATTRYVVGPEAMSGNLKIVVGQDTTVAAVDTIVTGLRKLLAVTVSADADPSIGLADTSASVGDQAGNPVAGSFLLKTWKVTSAADGTLLPATVFGVKVNWDAVGY